MARKGNLGAIIAAGIGGFSKGYGDQLNREDEFNRKLAELAIKEQEKKLVAEAKKQDQLQKQREDALRFNLDLEKARREQVFTTPEGGMQRFPGVSSGSIQELRKQAESVYGTPMSSLSQPPGESGKPPASGASQIKPEGLVSGVRQSVQVISRSLLKNPGALKELKIIQKDPTGMFEEIGTSDEGKDAVSNLRIAVANHLYLKTGAAATPGEINQNLKNFAAQIGDSPQVFATRISTLLRESENFAKRRLQGDVDIFQSEVLPDNAPIPQTHEEQIKRQFGNAPGITIKRIK